MKREYYGNFCVATTATTTVAHASVANPRIEDHLVHERALQIHPRAHLARAHLGEEVRRQFALHIHAI
jgi:hypothetical protein